MGLDQLHGIRIFRCLLDADALLGLFHLNHNLVGVTENFGKQRIPHTNRLAFLHPQDHGCNVLLDLVRNFPIVRLGYGLHPVVQSGYLPPDLVTMVCQKMKDLAIRLDVGRPPLSLSGTEALTAATLATARPATRLRTATLTLTGTRLSTATMALPSATYSATTSALTLAWTARGRTFPAALSLPSTTHNTPTSAFALATGFRTSTLALAAALGTPTPALTLAWTARGHTFPAALSLPSALYGTPTSALPGGRHRSLPPTSTGATAEFIIASADELLPITLAATTALATASRLVLTAVTTLSSPSGESGARTRAAALAVSGASLAAPSAAHDVYGFGVDGGL
jgi:hypothetical protein